MESKAESTLAFVLWAKNAKNTAVAAFWLAVLDQTLKSLNKTLAAGEQLAMLTDDQAKELAEKLQCVHSNLDFLLRRNVIGRRKNTLFFTTSLNGIKEGTEDLADVIEDLLLSCNKDFRSILGDCVTSLPIYSAEPVGRM